MNKQKTKENIISFPANDVKVSYFVEDPETHERCRVYVVTINKVSK